MTDPFDVSAVEERIDEYMSNDPLEITKTSLNEIPELSHLNWSELKEKIQSGVYKLNEMGPAQMSFHVVANPAQKSGLKFFNLIGFVVSIIAVILSIFVSWWLIFLVLLSPYMFKTAKGYYSQAIFQAALHSEKCFSFLFSRGVICLSGKDGLIYSKSE